MEKEIEISKKIEVAVFYANALVVISIFVLISE